MSVSSEIRNRKSLKQVEQGRDGWRLGRSRTVALITIGAVVGTVAFASGYLSQRELARQALQNNRRLAAAYDGLSERSAQMKATLQRQIAALQADDARDRETIAALNEIKDDMAARLATGEHRLRSVAAARDRALKRVTDLVQEIEDRDTRLESMRHEGVSLADQLAETEARLIEISDQHDVDQRAEANLRSRLASIQSQLDDLGARQAMAQNLIEGWVLGNLNTLEELVAGTGVDVDMLVARAAESEDGQGGPLQAMADEPLENLPLEGPMADDLVRLTALQRVTSSLPLGSPLDQFHITSQFGKRKDPFTKGLAFHSGLDLGAPPGSQVLATAPGIVRVAGPSGPYGNMVEIDHGMGVVTRYGHLKSVAVAVGDQVGFRQKVGVIGSTGRSTSLHLHYEVLVDGNPHDPGRFLDAGRYLVAVFDLGERGMHWLQQRSDGG